MFKRLREEWVYWRYRNITRRWILLKTRFRRTHRATPNVGSSGRARGTAVYMTSSNSNARGIFFVLVMSAIIVIVNLALHAPTLSTPLSSPLDALILVVAVFAFMRMARI